MTLKWKIEKHYTKEELTKGKEREKIPNAKKCYHKGLTDKLLRKEMFEKHVASKRTR